MLTDGSLWFWTGVIYDLFFRACITSLNESPTCVCCVVCVCVCMCVCFFLFLFFLSGRRRHPSNPPKSLFTLATSGDFKTLILECFVFSHRNKKLLSERVCVCVCVCWC